MWNSAVFLRTEKSGQTLDNSTKIHIFLHLHLPLKVADFEGRYVLKTRSDPWFSDDSLWKTVDFLRFWSAFVDGQCELTHNLHTLMIRKRLTWTKTRYSHSWIPGLLCAGDNISFESWCSQSIGQDFVEKYGMFVPQTADTDDSVVEETFLSHSNSFSFEMEKDAAGCRAFNRNYIVGDIIVRRW